MKFPFLTDLLKTEKLQPLFMNGQIERNSLKDLAGTDSPCKHSPNDIKLEVLLENDISVLEERRRLLALDVSLHEKL